MNVYKPHVISDNDAPKIAAYLQQGPIALYRSVNLSNPGASWLVPASDGKPNWQSADQPERLLNAEDFVVSHDVEVKRFHVALRMGSQGLSVKVSDGGSRRIRAAVAKAGEGAYHTFDGQDAVIMRPAGQPVPLSKWLDEVAHASMRQFVEEDR